MSAVIKMAALPKDYTNLMSPVDRIRAWMCERGHEPGGCDTIEDLLLALEKSPHADGETAAYRDFDQ